MRGLQILLILFGALALLSLGAVGASASAADTPPCHETGAATGSADHRPPDSPPSKAVKVMGCCVACVATPLFQPSPAAMPVVTPDLVRPASPALPLGRAPSPEHGPPRI